MRQRHASTTRHTRPSADRRRGSVYIAVMGVALIASIVGFSALALARARLKGTQTENDKRKARLLAQSAVEQAVATMNENNAWRSTYTNNVESSPINFDGGQMSFKLVDDDGHLNDDPTDAVWVYGYGRVGDAVWVERARARIDGGAPLEVLRTVLYSRSTLAIKNGVALAAVGGPVATDGTLQLNLSGAITGNAEARAISGTGTISGTATVPADRKGVPARTLFNDYKARATTLTFGGDLKNVVLAPGVNEYDGSGVNPDGVYYINTGGSNLKIDDIRLHGTLIIETGGGLVTMKACLLQPYREDFPTLIIKGNCEINSTSTTLSESSASHNFNPSGAKYLGNADIDKTDSYPNMIQGVFHVIGTFTVTKQFGAMNGVTIVDGVANVDWSATLSHDADITLNPPLGYTANPNSTKMIIHAKSWSRQAVP